MAKDYETELATPQRKIVRDGVIAALADLKKSAGLYLVDVRAINGVIKTGTDDEIVTLLAEVNGQSPIVVVACGRKTYKASGGGPARAPFHGELQVIAYIVSRNMRSSIARLEGDVVSDSDDTKDPGCEAICEQVEDRLIGLAPASSAETPGIYQLVPVEEDELAVGEDYLAMRIVFSLEVARERRRNRPGTIALDGMRARHIIADADLASEASLEIDAYDVDTAPDPDTYTITLVDARPAAIVAGVEVTLAAADESWSESAFVLSTDGTHAFLLERAPTNTPAAGDLVYVSINPIIVSEAP